MTIQGQQVLAAAGLLASKEQRRQLRQARRLAIQDAKDARVVTGGGARERARRLRQMSTRESRA